MLKNRSHIFVKYAPDIVILLLLVGLLYFGASWQIFRTYTDAARYQCYAVAFWQGLPALHALPRTQCSFITHPDASLAGISQATLLRQMQQWPLPAGLLQFVAAQSPEQPYHLLPNEYPLLNLIPFSLGLLVPAHWYQVAFACWMLALAAGIYLLLLRWRSRSAALFYAVCLLAGGWATVAGRFDILPSAITLISLLCADRKCWQWAFALLALATLLKFYPALLCVPYLLAQQMQARERWYAWRRWAPVGAFLAVGGVVMLFSLLLSVQGTLSPFGYLGGRPVQVESLAASLLWFLSLLGQHALTHDTTFGSLNVFSPFANGVSLLMTLLLAAGLLYTWWLQWRTKIDLALACLLSLLIVMVTSKVFSPQYLIWVIPLVAYVGGQRRRWLLCWGLIALLTTWIYPFIYNMSPRLIGVPTVPLFYPITTLRNLLLLGFILSVLIARSRDAARTFPCEPSVPDCFS